MSKKSEIKKPLCDEAIIDFNESMLQYKGKDGHKIMLMSNGYILASAKPSDDSLHLLGNLNEITKDVIDEMKVAPTTAICITNWLKSYLSTKDEVNNVVFEPEIWISDICRNNEIKTVKKERPFAILKRDNRFIMEFPKELCIEPFVVEEAQRPSIVLDTEEVFDKTTNKKYYAIAGYHWLPITFTMFDPIGPSTSQSLMEWLRMGVDSINGVISDVPKTYTKNLKLKNVDTAGVTVEEWELNGCVLKSIDFGKLDYKNGEAIKITVTVQPSYCVLKY